MLEWSIIRIRNGSTHVLDWPPVSWWKRAESYVGSNGKRLCFRRSLRSRSSSNSPTGICRSCGHDIRSSCRCCCAMVARLSSSTYSRASVRRHSVERESPASFADSPPGDATLRSASLQHVLCIVCHRNRHISKNVPLQVLQKCGIIAV